MAAASSANIPARCERAVGSRDDAALGFGQLLRGEAHGARHGLAVAEGIAERRAQHRLGGAGRHLDVVAEDVVVPDLQRLDAGLLLVSGLQRRHHLTALVAQRTGVVQILGDTRRGRNCRRGADAADRRRAPARAAAAGSSSQPARRAQISSSAAGKPMPSPPLRRSCAHRLCRGEPIANSAEVARRAALQGQPRQRARQIGRVPERAPDILAQRLALVQEADRIEPVTNSLGIAQAGWRAGPPARARRLL